MTSKVALRLFIICPAVENTFSDVAGIHMYCLASCEIMGNIPIIAFNQTRGSFLGCMRGYSWYLFSSSFISFSAETSALSCLTKIQAQTSSSPSGSFSVSFLFSLVGSHDHRPVIVRHVVVVRQVQPQPVQTRQVPQVQVYLDHPMALPLQ